MNEDEPVRTYYRSLTPDGKVWCESKSPYDFREPHPQGVPLTYERLDIYETNDGWQSWDLMKDWDRIVKHWKGSEHE